MSVSAYPRPRALFSPARRPTASEVDHYARLIAEREGCSFEACRPQAELQLWAASPTRPRKISAAATVPRFSTATVGATA